MKTSDLWNKFIAGTMNEKQMNFSYADFQKAINERVNTELRWIPIEEEMPTEFEKQLLVKNKNYNYVDLRFFNHQKQFDLLCKIHNYTHWRPIF